MTYLNNSSSEQSITCHFCFETFEIDLGIDHKFSGHNTEIFDCEVCCNPIQVSYSSDGNNITSFSADSIEQ